MVGGRPSASRSRPVVASCARARYTCWPWRALDARSCNNRWPAGGLRMKQPAPGRHSDRPPSGWNRQQPANWMSRPRSSARKKTSRSAARPARAGEPTSAPDAARFLIRRGYGYYSGWWWWWWGGHGRGPTVPAGCCCAARDARCVSRCPLPAPGDGAGFWVGWLWLPPPAPGPARPGPGLRAWPLVARCPDRFAGTARGRHVTRA